MARDFLSCDWGTTSFRLRWVSGSSGNVIREIREPFGVRSLHEELIRAGTDDEAARDRVFGGFLRAKAEALFAMEETPAAPLPLMISGMASSSVGWRELPYARAPFALDGRGWRVEELNWNHPDWIGPTYLISGVATEHEMMRGEESEIVGLMAAPELAGLREQCLLILPGTHSKHVRIENGAVVDWRTFMTGELFDVLGRHSLLRASIDSSARGDSLSESDRTTFREGVRWAQQHGLAGGLFRVRTRAVLDSHPPAENSWFFSGLLIGAELTGLSTGAGQPRIILAATSGLAEPYALALDIIVGNASRWIQLPADQVEQTVTKAHALFLNGIHRGAA